LQGSTLIEVKKVYNKGGMLFVLVNNLILLQHKGLYLLESSSIIMKK